MGSNGCRDSDVFLGAIPTVIAAANDWKVPYQNLTQSSNGMKTHLHVGEVPLCLEADKIKDHSKNAPGTATLSQGIILSIYGQYPTPGYRTVHQIESIHCSSFIRNAAICILSLSILFVQL